MGGQACVLHGAAEFTRDIDFAVGIVSGNLEHLRRALADLQAELLVFPPLTGRHLRRGHACHFRCHASGVSGLRIDVMARMRRVAPFGTLWSRRDSTILSGVGRVDLLAIPDLVAAKKTQRDKDWPMIRRLIEADYLRHGRKPTASQIRFWLAESRTPGMLAELSRRFPGPARRLASRRGALKAAIAGNSRAAERALRHEEDLERAEDRRYWLPLRREIEQWRLTRRRAALPR